jgi:hypothetical protein
MGDLVKNIGRLCENHVEKIVLALVGLVCAWLFFTRVVFSPVVLTVDNKKLTPGQIDTFIRTEKVPGLRAGPTPQVGKAAARLYKSPLTGTIDANDPVIAGLFDRRLPGGFEKLFDSPLDFISGDVRFTKPAAVPAGRLYAGRKYRLPRIPDLAEPAANYLRAAAYVPLEEITPKTTYDKAKVEPNDIDLVTVEAKFDTAELYRRFQACFNGIDVLDEQWRDPCLAAPVFAAVQVERRQRQEDGTWSDWQAVPRTQIEAHRTLFQVIEKIDDLPPGGLEVRLMQFQDKMTTMELLQPDAYQIASAEDDWFPPSYYEKFKTLQKRVEMEERRDQKEQRDREKASERQATTGRGGMTGGRAAMAPGRGGNAGMGDTQYGGRVPGGRTARGTGRGDQMMPGYDQPGRGKTRSTRRGPGGAGDPYGEMYMAPGMEGMQRKPTTDEAYWDFAKIMLSYKTDLAKLDKPLLIWAFDDTVEPGRTYRYRIRLGVFNPVAGTNQLVETDLARKDQVILWSPYAEVATPIEVRDKLYLFAKDARDGARTATVEVARYTLGYWHSEDFQVKLGETIGKEVEPKPEKPPLRGPGGRITNPRGGPMPPGGLGMPGPGDMPGMPGMSDYALNPSERANQPATVNYTTGKVLVDLVEVSDWASSPNLHPRKYQEMLYTGDGTFIEHMPVSVTNWPKDLVATYQYIQSEKRQEPQPFRAFNKGGLRGRGRRGMMPGMMPGYDDMGGGLYDDMQMDMPPGAGGPYAPYP